MYILGPPRSAGPCISLDHPLGQQARFNSYISLDHHLGQQASFLFMYILGPTPPPLLGQQAGFLFMYILGPPPP